MNSSQPREKSPQDQRLGAQRRDALLLLKATAYDLRRCYGVFVAATCLFAAVTFLPPRFLLLFTANAAQIQDVSLDRFMATFLPFGLLVGLALLISSLGGTFLREWFQLRVERHLRQRIMARLHTLPLTEIDRAQRGDWLTRMTADLRNVERFIAESLPDQLRSVVLLLGSGALFLASSRMLAVVPIAACSIIAVISVLVRRRTTPLLYELRELHGDIVQSLLQSLEGVKTVRSHEAQAYEKRRFTGQLDAVQSKSLRVARIFGALLGSTDIVIQMLTVGCLTFVMFVLSDGGMTLSEALIYPFYLNLFYGAAESLAASTVDWSSFFVEGGRLAELLRCQATDDNRHVPEAWSPEEGIRTIEVQDLSFGYVVEDPLFSRFAFKAGQGEVVAIRGASGCGKSTFLEVLADLREPFAGRWSIRSLDRVVRGSFASDRLPPRLSAYVEQRPYIFEGSIQSNLLLGKDATPVEVIWEALGRANAAEFVRQRGGLQAKLRDGGSDISEGQRYRLALARALLLGRPVLLLDEPFAALDRISTELICRSLDQLRRHRIVILVTHYIPNALNVDRIVDLEGRGDVHRERGMSINPSRKGESQC